MLKIDHIPVGPLCVNCYLAWDTDTQEALVFDPGDEASEIIGAIRSLKLKPLGILLTHGHVDHIRAVPEVASAFSLPVWIHPHDYWLYDDPNNAILPWLPAAENLPKAAPQPAALASHPYEIIETPGHTPGGVCYYFKQDGELISGDTLFRETYGRTDFPRGSEVDLFNSISTRLFILPDAVRVWPGHNDSTTIGHEKISQSYIK